MARKAWNHRKCVEHRKVEGYAKVCVLPGQDPEEIARFAEEMNRIAVDLGMRMFKPAGAKRSRSNPHTGCGGHFDYPAQGRICYGTYRMSETELDQAAKAAHEFSEFIGAQMSTNPRYARLYTGDFWSVN